MYVRNLFFLLSIILICTACGNEKKIHTTACIFDGYFDQYGNPNINVRDSNTNDRLVDTLIWSPDEKSMCIYTDSNAKVSKIEIYHSNGNLAYCLTSAKTTSTNNGVNLTLEPCKCYDEDGNEMNFTEFEYVYGDYINMNLKYFGPAVMNRNVQQENMDEFQDAIQRAFDNLDSN